MSARQRKDEVARFDGNELTENAGMVMKAKEETWYERLREREEGA